MIVRRILALLIALLLAVQVVRNAVVQQLAEDRPEQAAKLWADHPQVEISRGMTAIASATREHSEIDPTAFAMISRAAVQSPLAPEPFLVRGVQAQLRGDLRGAERAFRAAQWRDPRSLPTAYFLGAYYLRTGDAFRGLRQTAVLARLSPSGIGAVAPYVAAYAQNRANWPQIRELFRSQPEMEDPVLAQLAQAPANTDAILSLSDPAHRSVKSPWVAVLLQSLVDAGQYARARAIWGNIAHVAPTSGIFDSDFSPSDAPPPFNWSLTSSTIGLAERQSGGRLHALHYGQEDGVLARQLLVLPAGSYRLTMRISAALHPESLSWSVRCAKSNVAIASVALNQIADRGLSFRVPPDCGAQWLELSGSSSDIPQQSDVTISGLSLSREPGNA